MVAGSAFMQCNEVRSRVTEPNLEPTYVRSQALGILTTPPSLFGIVNLSITPKAVPNFTRPAKSKCLAPRQSLFLDNLTKRITIKPYIYEMLSLESTIRKKSFKDKKDAYLVLQMT